VDGAPLDVGDAAVVAAPDYFDVAVFLAFIAQDLDPDVDALNVEFVVGGLFAVEIDRVRVGRGRLGGHLEFVGRRLLPVSGSGHGRKDGQGKE
jgi:hypothetical protein